MPLFDDEGNLIGHDPWTYEPPEYYNIRFHKIAYETPKAWLVEVGWKQAWFPKNYCWFEDNVFSYPNWFKPDFTDIT